MVQCPKCSSYRVVSRILLVNPKTGKAQFRLTDLSLPILMIFIGAILYAAIDSLISPSGVVDQAFGGIFLVIFLATVLSLTLGYITRDRFIERLRYICTECKNTWDFHIPPPRAHKRAQHKEKKDDHA